MSGTLNLGEAIYGAGKPTRRLKFALCKSRRLPALPPGTLVTFCGMEAIGEKGEMDTSIKRPLEEVSSGYTRFNGGDVVVAKITPCFENGKGAVVPPIEPDLGFGTTELYVLPPGPELDARFLYYLTVSSIFRGLGEASMTGAAGQKRVPEEFVRDFPLWLPSKGIQSRIATFLDSELKQLDALVVEKERLLGHLKEKLIAFTSRSVTRGVVRSSRTRLSGVDWLGAVPANWHVRRCANLFIERDERNEPKLPLLNVSLNTGVTLRTFSEDRIESVAEDFASYKIARKNDLVANRMRFWQGAVGIAPVDGLTSPDYLVARIGPELLPNYVGLLFRTPQFSSEVKRYSHGMVDDRLRLYWDEFKTLRIPVPPISEQQSIVDAVEREAKRIAEAEETLAQSIALLKERRGALITAAITGRIEPATIGA